MAGPVKKFRQPRQPLQREQRMSRQPMLQHEGPAVKIETMRTGFMRQ
jgi:hypothetical protein